MMFPGVPATKKRHVHILHIPLYLSDRCGRSLLRVLEGFDVSALIDPDEFGGVISTALRFGEDHLEEVWIRHRGSGQYP